jgi:predicted house-cleaning NTP pyrophosphatase (Maf/HAM1 superfamily)
MTERSHSWRETVLVAFVGWLVLSNLVFVFTRKLGTHVPPQRRRFGTLRQIALLEGANPDHIGCLLVQSVLQVAVSIFLFLKGFKLLGAVAFGLYAVTGVLIAFACVLVNLPIQVKLTRPATRWWQKRTGSKVIVLGITSLLFALAIWTLFPVLGTLGKEDIRLGFLLGALAESAFFLMRFASPPAGLGELKALRTKLAFGDVDCTAARLEADVILKGPPREHYVTSKAEHIVRLLRERIEICNDLVVGSDQIIQLGELVRMQPQNEELVIRASKALKRIYHQLTSVLEADTVIVREAKRLRKQLNHRIEMATVLDLPATQIDAVVKNVDEIGSESDSARKRVTERLDSVSAAAEVILDARKSYPPAKSKTFREVARELWESFT